MGVLMSGFVRFLGNDDGAVTVDWVALTGGTLGFGLIVVAAVYNIGVGSLVNTTNANLTSLVVEVDPGSLDNLVR